MKLTYLIFFLFLTNISYSQKCKKHLVKEERKAENVDVQTQEQSYVSSVMTGTLELSIRCLKKKKDHRLWIGFIAANKTGYVGSGQSITLKLKNGNSLKFDFYDSAESLNRYMPTSADEIGEIVEVPTFMNEVIISLEDIKTLATVPILKVTHSYKNDTREVSKRRSKKLQETFQCFLAEVEASINPSQF
jgi:hypothetical protein